MIERGEMGTAKIDEAGCGEIGGRNLGVERVGLRAVALFEALKGAVVLAAGSGILLFVRPDVQAWAERLVAHMHLDPARKYPRIFLDAAERGDGILLALAAGALAYTTVRVVEAYGLWCGKSWAQWFAILSGAIYLPIEAWRFWNHHRPLALAAFCLNAAVVAFLLILKRNRTAGRKSPEPLDPPGTR
jgi:uncharacterized membrane protein (DUF2068 family)